MRRSIFLIAGVVSFAALVFAACYFAAARVRVGQSSDSTDELAWLRVEFKLSDAEMARVRQLHEGYMPKCEEMCARIAAKNRELNEALGASAQFTPALEQKLGEVAALRAECQGHMLRHYYEVSHAMPPAQGARYLAEMKRQTLGLHAQQEQAMTGTNHLRHVQP